MRITDWSIWIVAHLKPNYFSAFFSAGLLVILAYLQSVGSPAYGLTALVRLTGLQAETLIALGVIVVVAVLFETNILLSGVYNLGILFYAVAVLVEAIAGHVSPLGALSFWYTFNIAIDIVILTAYQVALKQTIDNHIKLRAQVNTLINK
jgi:hypothetical protein